MSEPGGGLRRFMPSLKRSSGRPAGGRGPGAVLARMSGRSLLISGAAVFALVLIVVSVVNHRGTKNTPQAASASSSSPQASAGTKSGSSGGSSQKSASGPGSATTGRPGAATGLEAIVRKNAGLPLKRDPSVDAATVADLQSGDTTTLLCWTQGDVTVGFAGMSTTWDRVRAADGSTGYVPDAWVETSAVVSTLVGSC